MRVPALAVCLLVLVSCLQLSEGAARGFIRVSNGKFVDEDCREFFPIGLNTWQLLEASGGVLPVRSHMLGKGRGDIVEWTFATAAANHLTVVRAFGHGVEPKFELQHAPGKYNEKAFAALDRILVESAAVGRRLILTLADNWQATDSKDTYVHWAKASGADPFFTDGATRKMFRDHITVMATRVNSINGLAYRDDPTIFAWDIMNEPRCNCFPDQIPAPPEMESCQPLCAEHMQAWIEEMSAHLKSVDPNHMVTVGEEGFWAPGSGREQFNPGNGWATITGQNFSANHAPATIDFASIHAWPDNWESWDLNFLDAWLSEHAAAAKELGKPLLVEEFGKEVHIDAARNKKLRRQLGGSSLRRPFYERAYAALRKSLQSDGALKGIVFWQWGFAPYIDPSVMGSCRHCQAIQVSPQDSIFTQVVVPAAEQASRVPSTLQPIAACSPVPAGSRSKFVGEDLLPGMHKYDVHNETAAAAAAADAGALAREAQETDPAERSGAGYGARHAHSRGKKTAAGSGT